MAETEQCADLKARGDGQQTPRLILAHHLRDLLRLADVINLGGKIQSPQRHTQQELQPGHDPIAVADARASLGQVQLKQRMSSAVAACQPRAAGFWPLKLWNSRS